MISLDTVWKEAPGQTKETLERLYVSVGLGIFPSISLAYPGVKWKKMDGWMEKYKRNCVTLQFNNF